MDRKVFALAARGDGTYSADVSANRAIGIEAVLAVSAKTGTGAFTLDCKFQLQDPASKNFIDIPSAAFAQFTDTGSKRLVIHPRVAAVANQAVAKAVTRHLKAVAVLVCDESQTATINGGVGGVDTFTLTFSGQMTAGLQLTATAAQVKTALENLSNIEAGDLTVTGGNGGPYTVIFGGTLANTNVAEMTGAQSGLGTVSVVTNSQGETSVTFGLHIRLLEA